MKGPMMPLGLTVFLDGEFLGAELLLHEDIYAGQPCPTDELNLWEPVPDVPYMGCHHFLTGHH